MEPGEIARFPTKGHLPSKTLRNMIWRVTQKFVAVARRVWLYPSSQNWWRVEIPPIKRSLVADCGWTEL
jgi:hypothetical protein